MTVFGIIGTNYLELLMNTVHYQNFAFNITKNMSDISSIVNDKSKFEKINNKNEAKYISVQAFYDDHEIGLYRYSVLLTLNHMCYIYITKASRDDLILKFYIYPSDKINEAITEVDNCFVYKTSVLEKFYHDMNLIQYKPIIKSLENDLKNYDFSIKSNIEVIFKGSEKFKKSLSLNNSEYNYTKYQLNDKKIIAYNNNATMNTYLILYEKDENTNTIRVLVEDGNKLDKRFNKKDRCYSKYKDIVKYCVENTPASVVIQNNEVKMIDEPYQIIETYDIAYALILKFGIIKEIPYNEEDLKDVLKYVNYESMNGILTYGIWTSTGKWLLNNNDEYYFKFDGNHIEDIIRNTKLKYNENHFGSILKINKKSMIKSLPNGVIKQEWANLIVDAYAYYIRNKNNFNINYVTEKEIKKVEKYLKMNGYIN